jgi:hypothetical protein
MKVSQQLSDKLFGTNFLESDKEETDEEKCDAIFF